MLKHPKICFYNIIYIFPVETILYALFGKKVGNPTYWMYRNADTSNPLSLTTLKILDLGHFIQNP